MTITEYEQQFLDILEGKQRQAPYNNENYLNYVKLNSSRMKRWYKTGKIIPELAAKITAMKSPQEWVLITEPWCGDAGQIHPFIAKMAALNPLITLKIQNRDAPNSEIENYLTNGGKSIPKLIVRDTLGKDLFTWGPRPQPAQDIHLSHLNNENVSAEQKKIELQNWYNQDKGMTTQKELLQLIQKSEVK